MELYTNKSSIINAIIINSRDQRDVQSEMHRIACSCLNHAEQHGDFTLATRFINAMRKSQRRNAVVLWFTMYGPFEWATTDKTGKSLKAKEQGFVKNRGDKANPFNLNAAMEKPFWELTKVMEGVDIDIAMNLQTSIERALVSAAKRGQTLDLATIMANAKAHAQEAIDKAKEVVAAKVAKQAEATEVKRARVLAEAKELGLLPA